MATNGSLVVDLPREYRWLPAVGEFTHPPWQTLAASVVRLGLPECIRIRRVFPCKCAAQ